MTLRISQFASGPVFALALGLALVPGGALADVKVAVGGPMTGGSAAFGAQLKQGVEQAVEDINAQGGILGQKLVLSVGDDRADPKEGVSAANKFAADGVKYVIGHFNSGVTIPASDVYMENGMMVITPAATNPKVSDRNMWCSGYAAATTSRASPPAPSSPSSSRASASPSSTTRRPTGRASPRKPARR
jgi:branched-chain amino acid transport system substrate-binding protein